MSNHTRSLWIRVHLIGLVIVDLIWRVPTVILGDSAGVDVAVAIISLAFGVTDIGFLEELTTWVLLGSVAAVLAPQAYPSKLGVPAKTRGFRVLFGAVTVVVAIGLRWATTVRTLSALSMNIVLVVLSGIVLIAYLRWGREWTLSPADPRFVTLIDAVYPTSSVKAELQADFSRPGWFGYLGVSLGWLAAVLILAIPVFLSGLVVVILLLLYPLPDLLVLGWAGLWVVSVTTGRDMTLSFATANLEKQLYDIVTEATRSLKGMTLGIYIVLLAFHFGLLFAVAFEFAIALDADVWRDPRLVWGRGGFVAVLVASSCYGIWCCFRMTRRLPTFLRHYANGGAARSRTQEYGGRRSDNRTLPPRPVGVVAPPLIVTLVLMTAFTLFGPYSIAFAFAWPLLLLALVGCVVVTRYIGSRSVRFDDHHVIIGTAGAVLTISVLGSFDVALKAVASRTITFGTIPPSIYMAAVVVWFGYFGDITRYANAHDDGRRLFTGGYVLAFTVVFGLLLLFTRGPYRQLFALIISVTAISGLALLVTDWLQL